MEADYIAIYRVEEGQIVLMGESLGGAVAADLAGADGARGVILQNSFSSLRDVAAVHYPWLAWLVPAGKLDSAARIAKYKGPLLQSHPLHCAVATKPG